MVRYNESVSSVISEMQGARRPAYWDESIPIVEADDLPIADRLIMEILADDIYDYHNPSIILAEGLILEDDDEAEDLPPIIEAGPGSYFVLTEDESGYELWNESGLVTEAKGLIGVVGSFLGRMWKAARDRLGKLFGAEGKANRLVKRLSRLHREDPDRARKVADRLLRRRGLEGQERAKRLKQISNQLDHYNESRSTITKSLRRVIQGRGTGEDKQRVKAARQAERFARREQAKAEDGGGDSFNPTKFVGKFMTRMARRGAEAAANLVTQGNGAGSPTPAPAPAQPAFQEPQQPVQQPQQPQAQAQQPQSQDQQAQQPAQQAQQPAQQTPPTQGGDEQLPRGVRAMLRGNQQYQVNLTGLIQTGVNQEGKPSFERERVQVRVGGRALIQHLASLLRDNKMYLKRGDEQVAVVPELLQVKGRGSALNIRLQGYQRGKRAGNAQQVARNVRGQEVPVSGVPVDQDREQQLRSKEGMQKYYQRLRNQYVDQGMSEEDADRAAKRAIRSQQQGAEQ